MTEIDHQLRELKAIAKRCRKVLQNTPDGTLSIQSKKSGDYYALCNKGTRDYIPVNDPIINAIQTGYCARQVLQAVEKDISLLEAIQDNWKEYNPIPEIEHYPKAYQKQTNEGLWSLGFVDPEEWKNRPYRKNTKHPEHLQHRTKSGLIVRSRGEAFIANIYEDLGIPIHYEEELVLPGGIRVYPDFTLLLGQRLKWHEHNGMLADLDYLEGYLWKEKTYMQAGIIPYRDVLFTFDGSNGEFDMQYLEYSIRRFVGK